MARHYLKHYLWYILKYKNRVRFLELISERVENGCGQSYAFIPENICMCLLCILTYKNVQFIYTLQMINLGKFIASFI